MRFGLVLGCLAAGLWAASAPAQDCCAGSKGGERLKEESGSWLEANARIRVLAPPASMRGSDPSVPVTTKSL
jgi:hypothetical protein